MYDCTFVGIVIINFCNSTSSTLALKLRILISLVSLGSKFSKKVRIWGEWWRVFILSCRTRMQIEPWYCLLRKFGLYQVRFFFSFLWLWSDTQTHFTYFLKGNSLDIFWKGGLPKSVLTHDTKQKNHFNWQLKVQNCILADKTNQKKLRGTYW